jgi:uncharacterized Zn ribbon protein
MAINVVCDCGKEFKVKDETAGKRVKCPACQTVLTVPEVEEEEAPRPKAGKKSSAFEDLGDGDEVVSRKGGKKKGSSKTLLFVGLGCGVLLLCVGCPSIGAALWFFVFNKPGAPEKVLVGKWKIDIEETKKILPESEKKNADFGLALLSAVVFEFKDDKTFIMSFGATDAAKGKWKVLSTKGDTATIELTDEKDSKKEPGQMTFTVLSNNSLKVVDKSDKSDKSGKEKLMVLKRI